MEKVYEHFGNRLTEVTVLQRWVGIVEAVSEDRFEATLTDMSNVQNPQERVELYSEEVSHSDRLLMVQGATFYWSVGYRDTAGGQRERISTLRFARYPSLKQVDINRALANASCAAIFLETD